MSRGRLAPIPASVDNLLIFLSYCHFHKKFSYTTIEGYLSALRTLHSIRSLDVTQFDSFLVKQARTGIRNRTAMFLKPRNHRSSMSFPALKILGTIISKKNTWPLNDRLSVWTVCLTAFWGSFRLGELISDRANTPTFHTLKWSQISFVSDNSGFNVFVQSPKASSDCRGQVSFVAAYSDPRYCPLLYMKRIRSFSYSTPDSYVFKFASGKYVYTQFIRSILKELSDEIPGSGCHFNGHSFRAALPSMMAAHPDIFSNREVRQTGKWSSDAADRYMRRQNVECLNSMKKVHALPDFALN